MSARHLISPVYSMGPVTILSEAEKDDLARLAWRDHSDLVTLRLSAIRCDVHRQAVVNEATRQHGARTKKRG